MKRWWRKSSNRAAIVIALGIVRRELELTKFELKELEGRIVVLDGAARYWRARAESQCHCTAMAARRTAGYDEWTGTWYNTDDPAQVTAVRSAALEAQERNTWP